jgi:hypothetical protein
MQLSLLFFRLLVFNNKKKRWGGGKKMRNFIFSFGSFSDIACVFA